MNEGVTSERVKLVMREKLGVRVRETVYSECVSKRQYSVSVSEGGYE